MMVVKIKNEKDTRKSMIKSKLEFIIDFKNCLEAAQVENKINELEKK